MLKLSYFRAMKVLPFRIPKTADHNLIVQVDKGPSFYKLLHQHEEIQLSYIVSGQGTLVLSDSLHDFASGDVFMIGGNMPHLFKSMRDIESAHMISVFFTKDSLGSGFFSIPEMDEPSSLIKAASNGLKLQSHFETVHSYMLALPVAAKFDRLLLFLKLLHTLTKAEKLTLADYVSSKVLTSIEGQRLQSVFDYAVTNFAKEVNLGSVSHLAHMTPPAFCRFFKQHTNKTFFEFLIELRIAHACQLLTSNTKLSIIEIAENSGFGSISNFNRRFKKVKGTTPSAYRRALKAHSYYLFQG